MKIIKINFSRYQQITSAVEIAIKQGKIIVCPTDTVYGLACDAANEKAVRRLFEIKNRPLNKSVPIFVKDIKMAKRMAFIDKRQEEFLRKYWPGRVTVVLKSRNKLPKSLGAEKTIGLRIPNYKFINDVLKKVNRPLTGTSANISGQPASGDIKEVLRQFKNRRYKPDLVIDAGRLPKRKPSKIIDLIVYPPKILRK